MSRCKLFNFSMSIGISGINEAFLGARRNIRIIDGDILYVVVEFHSDTPAVDEPFRIVYFRIS